MPCNSADEELKKSIEYMSYKIDELSKVKQEISQILAQNCRILSNQKTNKFKCWKIKLINWNNTQGRRT